MKNIKISDTSVGATDTIACRLLYCYQLAAQRFSSDLERTWWPLSKITVIDSLTAAHCICREQSLDPALVVRILDRLVT